MMAQQNNQDIEMMEDAIVMLVEAEGEDVELVVELDDVVQDFQDAPMQQLNDAYFNRHFNGLGKNNFLYKLDI